MSQVNTELGLSSTTTISLNQSNVRTLAGVPSGAISMNNLRGKSNQFAFTIASNQTNANLRTLAVNAGWNQSSKVVATINSGVYVSANSTGTPGLTINGSFPGGVQLVNNGFIIGMGGAGGTTIGYGFSPTNNSGASGGLALSVSVGVSIQNNGTIGGGGGGGGPGGPTAASVGCCVYIAGPGGGGGGRTGATNSAAGSGGPGSGAAGGAAGGVGTASGGGGGGAGATSPVGGKGGNGGSGGSWGANGGSGQNGTPYYPPQGGAGGAGGAAVSGNGNITWLATGTRLGAIS